MTLTPGMGMGGRPKITKTHKQIIRAKIVYTSGTFSKQNMKTNFNISSSIQKMKPNLNNALKITIYNTKHTNNTQTHLATSTLSRKKKERKQTTNFKYQTLCYFISKLHNSYFAYFIYFVFLYILYIYIYIYMYTYIYIHVYV